MEFVNLYNSVYMKDLIEQLRTLGLQEIYLIRLEMYVGIAPNISICCLINDIINNFHSYQDELFANP